MRFGTGHVTWLGTEVLDMEAEMEGWMEDGVENVSGGVCARIVVLGMGCLLC